MITDQDYLDSKAYWNHRAATFGGKGGKNTSPYVQTFIDRLSLLPGESVLDIGCATGTLALPFARMGHNVIARDFAENMIEILQKRIEAEKLESLVDAKVMAWEDDWEAFGLGQDAVDVAVASRCISGDNMEGRLEKLDKIARRRCAITVSASLPPVLEPRLMQHLGRPAPLPTEDIQALTQLANMGRIGELSFIFCERPMRFDNWDDALMELEKFAGEEPLNAHERDLFDQYAEEHFVETKHEDGTVQIALDYKVMVRWAFISWNTQEHR